MKTLIELYDENPIENVLGTEVFRPKEMVLLCPPEVESRRALKESLDKYFRHRGCPVKITIVPVSLLDADKVAKRIREVLAAREDCAIDISGGTDAALFAAGLVGAETSVYTYSRKKNAFFEVRNAPFARNYPCKVSLDVESCFLMAGGTLLPGREDSSLLREKLPEIDALFSVFRKYRKEWRRQIGYIQQISSSEPGVLTADGPSELRADHNLFRAHEGMLKMLEEKDLIRDLEIEDNHVHFSFLDETVRFWLRDIGAVLEVKVFRSCLEAECFQDVVFSAIVNWEGGTTQRNAVTNEIDVVAVRGIQPLFISCKTNEIRTEALNELAIIRDRFGGKGSRAMIVTSANATRSRAVMRMRANELGIEVVEWGDLISNRLVDRLKM